MFKNVVGIIIGLILLIGIMFGMGYLDNFYLGTIGKQRESIKREVFKENKSYVDGMVKELAKYKLEYEKTDSKQEKNAIRQLVIENYANFDIGNIENSGLRNFLQNMNDGGNE